MHHRSGTRIPVTALAPCLALALLLCACAEKQAPPPPDPLAKPVALELPGTYYDPAFTLRDMYDTYPSRYTTIYRVGETYNIERAAYDGAPEMNMVFAPDSIGRFVLTILVVDGRKAGDAERLAAYKEAYAIHTSRMQ